eukprot:4760175-Prymnesium_polylepis.1
MNELLRTCDSFSAGGAIKHSVLEASAATLNQYMQERKDGKKRPAQRVYEKSTLLWEADHWPAISLVEKLRASEEPYSSMSAERYDKYSTIKAAGGRIALSLIACHRLRRSWANPPAHVR